MTERTDKTAGAAADVIGQALDEVKVKKGTLASFVEAQAPEGDGCAVGPEFNPA